MKKKTYNILSHIPIANMILRYVICDPTIHCSSFLSEESDFRNQILHYQQTHPDEVITRNVQDKILKNCK